MAKQKLIRPYGSWRSRISGEDLVKGSLRLGQLSIDQKRVLWTEGRPEEKGRTALMEWLLSGKPSEITKADWDVRSRVHEYGGGAFHNKSGRLFLHRKR